MHLISHNLVILFKKPFSIKYEYWLYNLNNTIIRVHYYYYYYFMNMRLIYIYVCINVVIINYILYVYKVYYIVIIQIYYLEKIKFDLILSIRSFCSSSSSLASSFMVKILLINISHKSTTKSYRSIGASKK